MQLKKEGKILEPGQLILAYPPFCTTEASSGVSLKPVAAHEVIDFHARLASKLPNDDGGLQIEVIE